MFTKLISLFNREVPHELVEAQPGPGRTSELVRVGAGRAGIHKVTPERVEYTNEAGIDCIIDLRLSVKCERPIPIVGFRGMLDHPPWVRLFNERSTRFEFTDSDEAYEDLLSPLSKFGWATLDAN